MKVLATAVSIFACCSLCAGQTNPFLVGTTASVSLLSEVSSKTRTERFATRLEEPLRSSGQVLLPKETLFVGHSDALPARRLERCGWFLFLQKGANVKIPSGTEVQVGFDRIGQALSWTESPPDEKQ